MRGLAGGINGGGTFGANNLSRIAVEATCYRETALAFEDFRPIISLLLTNGPQAIEPTALMAFHATAWLLAFATLVGPSLCCCTTSPVASIVSRMFGGGTVACPSTGCCHHHPERPDNHTHGSHGDHHRHEHSDAHSTTLTKQNGPAQEQNPPPRECPCRQHRSEIIALPVTVDIVAGVSLGQFDRVWVSAALPLAMSPSYSAHSTALHGPETACPSGREILRAHCVLRI